MNVYAQATTQDLLAAIPSYEETDCDVAAISVAYIRQIRPGLETFTARGVTFPASNFSSIHLILTPLVREEHDRRTLAPVAAYLHAYNITHLRVVGEGSWTRQHQYSRDGGQRWGAMRVRGEAPPQLAPTVVIKPRIGIPPTETDAEEPF